MKVYIQDAIGDHNLEDEKVEAKIGDYITHLRNNDGYFVQSTKRVPEYNGHPATEVVDGVIFVPWHQIHYIKFYFDEPTGKKKK